MVISSNQLNCIRTAVHTIKMDRKTLTNVIPDCKVLSLNCSIPLSKGFT